MRTPGGNARPKIDGQAIAAGLAELGEVVRHHRISQGLSQPELARLAGIPQSKISPLEKGRGNPTLSTLLRIGRALGLELAWVPIKDAKPER